jgi:hypothetical protein
MFKEIIFDWKYELEFDEIVRRYWKGLNLEDAMGRLVKVGI